MADAEFQDSRGRILGGDDPETTRAAKELYEQGAKPTARSLCEGIIEQLERYLPIEEFRILSANAFRFVYEGDTRDESAFLRSKRSLGAVEDPWTAYIQIAYNAVMTISGLPPLNTAERYHVLAAHTKVEINRFLKEIPGLDASVTWNVRVINTSDVVREEPLAIWTEAIDGFEFSADSDQHDDASESEQVIEARLFLEVEISLKRRSQEF